MVSGTSGARTRTEAGWRSEWDMVLYARERCVRRKVGDWAGKCVVRSAQAVAVVVAVVVLPSVSHERRWRRPTGIACSDFQVLKKNKFNYCATRAPNNYFCV